MSAENSLEDRVAELEARVAALEATAAGVVPDGVPFGRTGNGGAKIELIITNKRYQPADPMNNVYQDTISFDCEFRATQLDSLARAAKGMIEFCDLFGEPRCRIGYTLNERLQPGSSVRADGLGFQYNQFMEEHKWMLATELADMTFRFQITQILYENEGPES